MKSACVCVRLGRLVAWGDVRDLNEQTELLKIKSANVKLETSRHVTGRDVQAECNQAQLADSHTHEGMGVPLRSWADLRLGWLSGRISSH